MQNIKQVKLPIKAIVIAILTLIALYSSIYTVTEGHIGIVKRFSEAKE